VNWEAVLSSQLSRQLVQGHSCLLVSASVHFGGSHACFPLWAKFPKHICFEHVVIHTTDTSLVQLVLVLLDVVKKIGWIACFFLAFAIMITVEPRCEIDASFLDLFLPKAGCRMAWTSSTVSRTIPLCDKALDFIELALLCLLVPFFPVHSSQADHFAITPFSSTKNDDSGFK